MTPRNEDIYKKLRYNYLVVYLLASFADWLQGPYLYQIYSNYNYETREISILYAAGFASAMITGLVVGHCANVFGRKHMCVFYGVSTSIACIGTCISSNFIVLLVARCFGGASTSILFSTFESWYIGQHLYHYCLDAELMAQVLTQSTTYNGALAIFAGLLSSLLADVLNFGPTAPFLLAVPVSLCSSYICTFYWKENSFNVKNSLSLHTSIIDSVNLMFSSSSSNILLILGIIQSIYETVLYIFVFLWSPTLETLDMSQGSIFGLLMLCVMIGSALSSSLSAKFHVKYDKLLCLSVVLSAISISVSTLGVYIQKNVANETKTIASYICLVSFMFYEISVGIYYPSIGYLRGIVVPESGRTIIANFFRLPSNLLVCLGISFVGTKIYDNFYIFSFSCCALIVNSLIAIKFTTSFKSSAMFHSIL